jgi:hypothetical protein
MLISICIYDCKIIGISGRVQQDATIQYYKSTVIKHCNYLLTKLTKRMMLKKRLSNILILLQVSLGAGIA